MRRASTQVPCGRWRALSFRYIDVQSSSRVESVDAVADYLEKKLFGPLLSSLRDRNPTPRFLSRSQLSALKTILAAAYEWNHKVKSQFMSLDYHVSLPRDKQFDEWSMQYLGNKKVVDPSRQIISVISLGLESSDAGGPGTQPNRVWQEKITVLTEDYFEQA
ncbi:uncharacterized protein EI90DRAFT_2659051 [Cantharellus anzutake]|uniref:uncharacterized protein n=1 Tax=Cantharellus anzutake TaxID=1750568 RepID=UPI001904B3D8|nr:uncharacterized protein EI90DRAFT_2659051 [Cantharellus anzutake]KAF8337509.1 hypothetical protein EI90DRAFT_2659051 [Cantharellus anzutake]